MVIVFMWTLFWAVAPFLVAPPALVWAGRYLMRRGSTHGWADEWSIHHQDLSYQEHILPDMRKNRHEEFLSPLVRIAQQRRKVTGR